MSVIPRFLGLQKKNYFCLRTKPPSYCQISVSSGVMVSKHRGVPKFSLVKFGESHCRIKFKRLQIITSFEAQKRSKQTGKLNVMAYYNPFV